MTLNRARARQALRAFDFKHLFIEELGWDRPGAATSVRVDGHDYALTPAATKRGLTAFVCAPGPDGIVPPPAAQRAIQRQVAKAVHEHLIIFVDAAATTQVWQWVKREPGRPLAVRQHYYATAQPGDALVAKLEQLVVTLDEEERLTVVDVVDRVRQAFDVDRVTKRFYDRFKQQHAEFLSFIAGVQSKTDREWYASLMLNRLMFVYFIQKKGFLDADTNYLRNRLGAVQRVRHGGRFLSFYRVFLLRLFHDGLGAKHHNPDLVRLLGDVPYLNGGMFELHELEQRYPDVDIPDEAFAGVFDFFDAYQWHLDERPVRADNEINPDVLGFIFEKYVNQKETGAYYTKEDITEYIAQNTIVPYVFAAGARDCAIAFGPSAPMWAAVRAVPDRYIFATLRHGVDVRLPGAVSRAVGGEDREALSALAAPTHGLPGESWADHLGRRERVAALRETLARLHAHTPDELTSYNIDLRQLAQDAIDGAEGPDLLRALYQAIRGVTVLDPTCGSGAFLFAALNVLEPLYEACLERMEGFVAEADALAAPESPQRFSDFRAILADAARHPSRRYFVLKSIVVHNLYGVDVMREAAEICKLRLFLKLVAQIEIRAHLEPLPDIDFNIRAGNTLVGFATFNEAERAVSATLDFADVLGRVRAQAEAADEEFARYRDAQLTNAEDAVETRMAKRSLTERLRTLRAELDGYLASEYGIEGGATTDAFAEWREAHAPFHWFVEFHAIMARGGFGVVVGNPPYVEYAKVRAAYSIRGYETTPCGNLYAFVLERSQRLTARDGRAGFIVPLSFVGTRRMRTLRQLVLRHSAWISSYDMRPSSLFEGVAQRLCIVFAAGGAGSDVSTHYSGGYRRWAARERAALLPTSAYIALPPRTEAVDVLPKVGSDVELRILDKIRGPSLGALVDKTAPPLYLHRIVRYYVKALDFVPFFKGADGKKGRSPDYKEFRFQASEAPVVTALLNSTLFYWYWRLHADGFHCGYGDVHRMPYRRPASRALRARLVALQTELTAAMKQSSSKKTITTKAGKITYEEFSSGAAKPIIDRIDGVLAEHYGFTDDEIAFVLNYDAKYRSAPDEDDGDFAYESDKE